MIDFKAQILKDLAVFHNPKEFASIMNIWYGGMEYTVPAILDHEEAKERQKLKEDHAEGLNYIEAVLYLSLADFGIVPEKGCTIEIEEAGAVKLYEIMKSSLEHGEIILELGAYDE